MSCANRVGKIRSDLAVVRVLAQQTANLIGANQIIYKVFCNGITIYKFSDNWKGTAVETVTPETSRIPLGGNNPSENILSSTEDKRTRTSKSIKDRDKE